MNEFKFNLCIGEWHQYFRDKNTLKTLTHIMVIQLFEEKECSFKIPDELIGNKDAEIVVKRVR